MARFTLEEFESRSPTLVYIAGNMVEAESVERVLSEYGIDYALNIDSYSGTSILSGVYEGLFVYVGPDKAEESRRHLEANGLRDTVNFPEMEGLLE